MRSVPLFVLGRAQASSDKVIESTMEEIRSSDYIREALSGEESPEESTLWNLIAPASSQGDTNSNAGAQGNAAKAIDALVAWWASKPTLGDDKTWAYEALVIYDDQSDNDNALLTVQVDPSKGEEVARLRVAKRSLLEVVQNLTTGGMGLQDVSAFLCPA